MILENKNYYSKDIQLETCWYKDAKKKIYSFYKVYNLDLSVSS